MTTKSQSRAPEAKYHVVAAATAGGDNSTLFNVAVFECCGDACDAARVLLTVRTLWAETRVLRVQGRNETTAAVYRREAI